MVLLIKKFFSVPPEAEGSGDLSEHAEDHPAGPGPGRQEVPERLGAGRVPEEQERHGPGRHQDDDHTGQQPLGGAAEISGSGQELTSAQTGLPWRRQRLGKRIY